MTLSGSANSVSQVQAAIQAATGNTGITAAVSGGNLVLTDSAGNPITATLTSLHSYTGATDNGAFASPTIANGTPASAAPPTFTDPGGILATVGILQNTYTKTVTPAQDAKFNIDGLDLTRSTNTVSDVIPGATISLLSGSAASPATTTLSVTQNTASTVSMQSSRSSPHTMPFKTL